MRVAPSQLLIEKNLAALTASATDPTFKNADQDVTRFNDSIMALN